MIPFPNKKYNIIYADPAWHFSNWSGKGTVKAPINHYNTIKLKDICVLPVNEISANNCILFIWCVDPLLDKAFDVIKSWNFTFKTMGFVTCSSFGDYPGDDPNSVFMEKQIAP